MASGLDGKGKNTRTQLQIWKFLKTPPSTRLNNNQSNSHIDQFRKICLDIKKINIGDRQMDKALSQFLAVAETGSITQASERLNVTQPTISVNLQKLEAAHKVALFERNPRGMELTQFGQVLYNHARVMARLEEHATAEIRTMRSSKRHAVKIGCGFAWWSAILKDVVADFRRENPNVSILIEICNSNDGLKNILSGDIAFFLGTRVDHISPSVGVAFEALFAMEDRYFVRKGHPLLGRPVTMANIQLFDRLDVVPLENSHFGIVDVGSSVIMGSPLNDADRIVLSSNSMSVCLDLLAGSDAILPYPEISKSFFSKHDIAMLHVVEPQESHSIGFYSLGEKLPDENTKGLLQRIREVIQSKPNSFHLP